jgi:hypothetical protein
MADLLLSRIEPGVARVRSTDPFDSLEIYRIDRESWGSTPERPGVYMLYGPAPDGALTVYIGKSETNMRARIRSHHVNPSRNWFGTLFAVPLPNPLLCSAVEAELIGQVEEAGVVGVIENIAPESRYRGSDDVHVEPAVEKVRDSLQLVLGADIFVPSDDAEPTVVDAPIRRLAPLSRENRGLASDSRARTSEDPPAAERAWVGQGIKAWGRFEGEEPETRFRVLAGSQWRRAVLNPENVTYPKQLRLSEQQQQLVDARTLDPASETRLSSPFGGDSSVRKGDLDAGAAEVDHRDQRVGGVESVCAV